MIVVGRIVQNKVFSDNLCRDARVVNGYDSNCPTHVEVRYHMVSAA